VPSFRFRSPEGARPRSLPCRNRGARRAFGCHAAAVDVSLREVTDANRHLVEQVGVSPAQSNYVSSVTESLADAAETPEAAPRYWALYADEEVVGFVMISDGIEDGHPELVGPYYLWRLLVDTRWQGRGLGRAALDLVVDHLRTHRPDATELLTSVAPGTIASPRGFYEAYGFRPTGEVADGEDVLALPLR
jgi:diamine N-acetyltransferase